MKKGVCSKNNLGCSLINACPLQVAKLLSNGNSEQLSPAHEDMITFKSVLKTVLEEATKAVKPAPQSLQPATKKPKTGGGIDGKDE